VPELNIGRVVYEVEHAAPGRKKVLSLPKLGGSSIHPEEILEAIEGRNPLMNPMGEKYLRKDSLPFCGALGCGKRDHPWATVRAIDQLGVIDDVALIAGSDVRLDTGSISRLMPSNVLHGEPWPLAPA